MWGVYDAVRQVLGECLNKEGIGLALVVVLLQFLLRPLVARWHACRQHRTAHYPTDHTLSRAHDLPPAPYQDMPRRQGPEAEYLRKLFDNPVYLHQYIALGHKQLGPVFRDDLGGPVDLVFLGDASSVPAVYRASGTHPGHVVPEAWTLYLRIRDKKRGLFFMDGPEWVKHRKILNQRLQRSACVKRHLAQLDVNTAMLMDTLWRQQQLAGQLEDTLRLQLYRWSLECISVVALGRRVGSFRCESDPRCQFSTFVEAIHAIFQQTAAMGQMPPEQARELQTEAWCRFCEACDTALDIASRYASEALQDREKRAEGPVEEASSCLLDSLLEEDGLSDQMVTRLIADLFLAAADTTVWGAIWLLFVVGRHPEFAASARRQINALSPPPVDVDGVLTLDMDALKKLSECRSILKETLRLYPVAPFITRLLATDSVIAGYHVPADTMSILSVYSIGRDGKYFANPQKFDPGRWETNASSKEGSCPVSIYSKDNRQDQPQTPCQTPETDSVSSASQSSPTVAGNSGTQSFSNGTNPHKPESSSPVINSPKPEFSFHGESLLKPSTSSDPPTGPDTPAFPGSRDPGGVSLTKLASMPWGIGPRNCVGRTVAETVLTLFLAHLLHNFDVALENKEEVHLKMQMISVPSENLDIRLKRVS